MNQLNFSSFEISTTGAIGGLLAMPFPFLMGWLSDRTGRKGFLYFSYLLAVVSIVSLIFSKTLWNFWLVFALSGIASGGNSIGNALITDLVPRESIGKGLSIYGSGFWVGGVVGFAVSGLILENMGVTSTCIIGAILALASVGLLIPVQDRSRKIALPHPAVP